VLEGWGWARARERTELSVAKDDNDQLYTCVSTRDALYGDFDSVDTVERMGESSRVRVGDCEMTVVG